MNKEYDLIIKNGTLVTPRGQYKADIFAKDGRIAVIARELSPTKADQQIDAEGLHVLPGCIDSHMHLWEPGLVAREDFRDGTRTEAAGGITTIIDHPLTIPEVLDTKVFYEKRALGERTSYIDFALHGGVGLDNLHELKALWQAGCTAFKIFMCESGSQVAGLDSGRLLAAFKEIGSFAGTAILHAEDESMIRANKRMLDEQGRKDYLAFTAWRPAEAEIEAIHRALFLLQDTGARAIFLHTTVPEGVEMVTQARADGLDAWVETCPHNLYLSEEHLAALGPWATYSPPVRSPERVQKLWQQLEKGLIITMGSDHGPVDRKLKESGVDNIWKEQFGIPGAETMLPLMLNAVNEKRITLERLVAILAENPARMYGLYPHKGVIQVGADADFTIVDLARPLANKSRRYGDYMQMDTV